MVVIHLFWKFELEKSFKGPTDISWTAELKGWENCQRNRGTYLPSKVRHLLRVFSKISLGVKNLFLQYNCTKRIFMVAFLERPSLMEEWKVEKIQEIYLEALKVYVDNQRKPRSNTIFAKLLSVLTELRTLGNQNFELCFALKLKNKKLPPFLAEVWDITPWGPPSPFGALSRGCVGNHAAIAPKHRATPMLVWLRSCCSSSYGTSRRGLRLRTPGCAWLL